MVKYTQYSTTTINGKKKNTYKKSGSTKQYIKSKGRYISLTRYRKMKATKATTTPVKSSKTKRRTTKK